MQTVAIVGAGPAGLVAARYLKQHGFTPVLFEQDEAIGGQWRGGSPWSGIWPSMRTNTSRIMTSFSDLPHPTGTPVFPTNQAILAYLQSYARRFDVLPHVRTGTQVLHIELEAGPKSAWRVRSRDTSGREWDESFRHVVVASGRFNKPRFPDVPGLDPMRDRDRVSHTFYYRSPEAFRGKRVLVAGGSISALEIASELAMRGATHVVSAQRRQRYVLQKLLSGIPTDHLAFTRFAALAYESFPPEVNAQALRDFILRTSGSPEQFGALKPLENVIDAGITQAQHFLPLVAEGRIAVRPWITRVEGRVVHFEDGTSEEIDSFLFGTGFELSLPFLDNRLREVLRADSEQIDLHLHTFHPDLPGLAFLGMYDLVGPFFPTVELQARWLTYVWSGKRAMPSRAEMEAGIATVRESPPNVPMHVLAVALARAAGVEPDVETWSQLARALLFGPLSPVSFRLSGPDRLPDAAERTRLDAAAFGAVPSPQLSPEQDAQVQMLYEAQQAAKRHAV